MQDYTDPNLEPLLAEHQLNDFAALWALQLEAVDVPNTERGGWSSVARLQLGEQGLYLKRQINHLTRSLRHPLGEPTFAREFRTIQQYQRLGIPALKAAYFAQRKVGSEQRAILITYALDGWQDLDDWFGQWPELSPAEQKGIIHACAHLAKTLHAAGQMHGCFYPKHIFLQRTDAYNFTAQLIDLEKTRPLLLGQRDRIKDLETLVRRSQRVWGAEQWRDFLHSYLDDGAAVENWLKRLQARRKDKENRA